MIPARDARRTHRAAHADVSLSHPPDLAADSAASVSRAPLPRRLARLAGIGVLCSLATVSAATREDRVVDLPPLVVEESATPLRWRHADLPGKEVLSACPDAVTRDFLRRLQLQTNLLAWLLPPSYQASSVIPDTYLLLSTDTPRATSAEILHELLQRRHGDRSVRGPAPRVATDGIRFLPNLRLLDVDATVVFVLLDDEEETGGFSFTIERVRQLLVQRRPRLPPWLVQGLLQLYPELSFESEELRADPARWPARAEKPETAGEDAPTDLVPMATLLAWRASEPGTTPALAVEHRDAQSALFVRWALIDGTPARRTAFWRLVDRLEREPATDSLLRAELGLDFAELDEALRLFLPRARHERRRIREASPGNAPTPALRDATPAEIARIRGDWERLSIGYVRQRIPELVPRYVERARRTARAGYDQGSRDPSLLAVMGLIEIDAGHPDAARAWLEQAASLGAPRPRALLELALLRFADIDAATQSSTAPPTAEQVAAVLGPLQAADALQPALPPVYTLQAELWARTHASLSPDQLSRLRRASALFPESSHLALRTAQLLALHDQTEAAREVIRRARPVCEQPAIRPWLDRLEASLESPRGDAPRAQEPQLQRSGSQR